MLNFESIGFKPSEITTDLGKLVYYSPLPEFWGLSPEVGNRLTDYPLVFFHSLGGGSSAFEWSGVFPAFAPSHRVIAPDLIGWGRSAHPARAYTTEDYLGVITRLLEQVAAQPAVVVASSLTAGVMIRLAGMRPELFRGLFLISPLGNADFGRDYPASLPAQLAKTPGIDWLLYQLGAANPTAVQGFLSTFLLANPSRLTADIVSAYLAGTQLPQAAYSALASLKGDISFDLARYLPQLTVPTAFVVGQASRFTPPAVTRRLASLNPAAVRWLYQVADVGVLPQLERPAVVIGLLTQFLSALEALEAPETPETSEAAAG